MRRKEIPLFNADSGISKMWRWETGVLENAANSVD